MHGQNASIALTTLVSSEQVAEDDGVSEERLGGGKDLPHVRHGVPEARPTTRSPSSSSDTPATDHRQDRRTYAEIPPESSNPDDQRYRNYTTWCTNTRMFAWTMRIAAEISF